MLGARPGNKPNISTAVGVAFLTTRSGREHQNAQTSVSALQTRRRTNVQQLTCNIDLSSSFYYVFFSLVLIELKPFALKGKVLGKNSQKMWKIMKKCENYETILPFSCCPLLFLWCRHAPAKFLQQKTRSDSKVTTPNWPKSDPKVTQK